MKIDEIMQLSNDELRKLAMKKDSRGCYTDDANKAQMIRQERSGYWVGVPRKPEDEFKLDVIIEKAENETFGAKKYGKKWW